MAWSPAVAAVPEEWGDRAGIQRFRVSLLLLIALTAAGPAAAGNSNLTDSAQYSAFSYWESDRGSTTFMAARAFDGDLATRRNVAGNDQQGSWIAAVWPEPVIRDMTSGDPVRRATGVSDGGQVLGMANDRGEFHLLVEPGDYSFQAYAEGYFSGARASVTVEAGETQEVTLAAARLGANIAGTARASASSQQGEQGAALPADGNPGTCWLARVPAEQWLALTWESPVQVTAIQLRGFQDVIQRSFLQVLDEDGQTWVDLPETSFAPQFLGSRPADFFFLRPISTRGVRYFITATHSTSDFPGLGEILVYDSTALAP